MTATMEMKLDEDLRDVPFEEIGKLKDTLGTKVYAETIFGSKSRNRQKTFSRANKNRPREESSKVRPITAKPLELKPKFRDPRFDERSGAFDERVFKQTYKFLDEFKKNEKQELLNELKEETDPDERKRLRMLINRIESKEKAEAQKVKERLKNLEKSRELTEQLKEGKNPFYKTKSDKRKEELVEKFKTLKETGRLEKYLTKKRKKNKASDRKHLGLEI